MNELATTLDISGLLKNEDAGKEYALDVPVCETDPLFHDVTLTARFRNLSGVLTCKAHITGKYDAVCDRCLEAFVLPLQAEIDTVVTADDSKDDSITVKNSRIDLVKTCFDALSLELPLVLLCREDCKGLCPVCGTNRNVCDCGCQN